MLEDGELCLYDIGAIYRYLSSDKSNSCYVTDQIKQIATRRD